MHFSTTPSLTDQLANVGPESDILPVHRQEVSNAATMAKDGKSWFDPQQQQAVAERVAAERCQLEPERKTLKTRLLVKWRGK